MTKSCDPPDDPPQVSPPKAPVLTPCTDANDRDGIAHVTAHGAATADYVLQDILMQLRLETGHDFKHYKRAAVLRRVQRRMHVTAQPDLPAYYRHLLETPEETKALLADMLIGVTHFFRDRAAFDALEREALPRLVSAATSQTPENDHIRVWSAGCSTGEEAYSLAMIFNDQLQLDASKATLQLFATDIDDRAIEFGRAGRYPLTIVTEVSPARLRQYFIKEDEHYRIRKEIREKVLFAKHSLLSDPPFSKIDLIVCRNLLIYLDRDAQREVLQMFHFSLRPGGYLFIGSAENVDGCHDVFEPVDKQNRIFRSKTGTADIRRAPTILPKSYRRSDRSPEPLQPKATHKSAFSDIHQRAREYAALPSVIIDANANILHMSESAGRFLRYAGGEITHHLLTLIMEELQMATRALLFQVQQNGSHGRSSSVQIERDGQRCRIELVAHSYNDELSHEHYVLVIFQETEVPTTADLTTNPLPLQSQAYYALEANLHSTQMHLQDLIELTEISSEELKASNEEMQAINEELRSTTEELHTSREDLQSTNDELQKINLALELKIAEVDQKNAHLTRLLDEAREPPSTA